LIEPLSAVSIGTHSERQLFRINPGSSGSHYRDSADNCASAQAYKEKFSVRLKAVKTTQFSVNHRFWTGIPGERGYS